MVPLARSATLVVPLARNATLGELTAHDERKFVATITFATPRFRLPEMHHI